MENIIEIKDLDILEISPLRANIAYNVGAESKMHGLFYNQYRYNGSVFIVPSTDKFVKAQEEGSLYKVKLIESQREIVDTDDQGVERKSMVRSYSYDSSILSVQYDGVVSAQQHRRLAEATFDAEIAKISKSATSNVDEDLLAKLLKAVNSPSAAE